MRNITDVQRGGKLKDLRVAARLTQKAVGDHFGIDKASVSEWERGRGRPTVDKLKRLDSLYGGNGAVLQLFDVETPSGRKRGDSTGEVLRSEMARVLEVIARLEKRVAKLESRDVAPGSRVVR